MKLSTLDLFLLASTVLFATVSASKFSHTSIGNHWTRTWQSYVPLPSNTTLVDDQWARSPECDPNLGYAYTYGPSPKRTSPLTLFYTASGVPSGIRVTLFGHGAGKAALIDKGYVVDELFQNQYTITVSFRNSSVMCDPNFKSVTGSLGDRLVVNQHKGGIEIPVLENEARQAGWTRGSCIETMGRHYMCDISGGGSTCAPLSWDAEVLVPIVPMYHQGSLSAFFFLTNVVQQQETPNWWESIAIPTNFFCGNLCDSMCHFANAEMWSTMHIFTQLNTDLKCPNDCKFSCCE